MILDIPEERIYELENTTVEFIRNQTQSEKLKYMEKQLSNRISQKAPMYVDQSTRRRE